MLLKGTKMAFLKLIHSGILMVKGYFTKKKKKSSLEVEKAILTL